MSCSIISIKFDLIQFNSTQINSIRFDFIKADSIRFDSIQFVTIINPIRSDHVHFTFIEFNFKPQI